MNPVRIIEQEILMLLREKMALDVPSPAVDLIAAGHMDSPRLAELFTLLETDLAVRVSMEDLDPDQTRTVAGIARAVARELCWHEPREGAGHGDAPALH